MHVCFVAHRGGKENVLLKIGNVDGAWCTAVAIASFVDWRLGCQSLEADPSCHLGCSKYIAIGFLFSFCALTLIMFTWFVCLCDMP